jgi:hypothetical protein
LSDSKENIVRPSFLQNLYTAITLSRVMQPGLVRYFWVANRAGQMISLPELDF